MSTEMLETSIQAVAIALGIAWLFRQRLGTLELTPLFAVVGVLVFCANLFGTPEAGKSAAAPSSGSVLYWTALFYALCLVYLFRDPIDLRRFFLFVIIADVATAVLRTLDSTTSEQAAEQTAWAGPVILFVILTVLIVIGACCRRREGLRRKVSAYGLVLATFVLVLGASIALWLRDTGQSLFADRWTPILGVPIGLGATTLALATFSWTFENFRVLARRIAPRKSTAGSVVPFVASLLLATTADSLVYIGLYACFGLDAGPIFPTVRDKAWVAVIHTAVWLPWMLRKELTSLAPPAPMTANQATGFARYLWLGEGVQSVFERMAEDRAGESGASIYNNRRLDSFASAEFQQAIRTESRMFLVRFRFVAKRESDTPAPANRAAEAATATLRMPERVRLPADRESRAVAVFRALRDELRTEGIEAVFGRVSADHAVVPRRVSSKAAERITARALDRLRRIAPELDVVAGVADSRTAEESLGRFLDQSLVLSRLRPRLTENDVLEDPGFDRQDLTDRLRADDGLVFALRIVDAMRALGAQALTRAHRHRIGDTLFDAFEDDRRARLDHAFARLEADFASLPSAPPPSTDHEVIEQANMRFDQYIEGLQKELADLEKRRDPERSSA